MKKKLKKRKIKRKKNLNRSNKLKRKSLLKQKNPSNLNNKIKNVKLIWKVIVVLILKNMMKKTKDTVMFMVSLMLIKLKLSRIAELRPERKLKKKTKIRSNKDGTRDLKKKVAVYPIGIRENSKHSKCLDLRRIKNKF